MIKQFSDFLTGWDFAILPALYVAVWVFAAANWIYNPYRLCNKRFARCRRELILNKNTVALHVAMLPDDYRRQWRAYANGNALRPSQVFQFVPRKNKVVFLHLFVGAAIVSCCYLVLFCADVSRLDYIVFQAAFWATFALALVVKSLLFARKERSARQAFGQLVAQLNTAESTTPRTSPLAVAKQIDKLKRDGVTDASLARAAELVRQLSAEPRSVDDQRKINQALNGLLQSYARSRPSANARLRVERRM